MTEICQQGSDRALDGIGMGFPVVPRASTHHYRWPKDASTWTPPDVLVHDTAHLPNNRRELPLFWITVARALAVTGADHVSTNEHGCGINIVSSITSVLRPAVAMQ